MPEAEVRQVQALGSRELAKGKLLKDRFLGMRAFCMWVQYPEGSQELDAQLACTALLTCLLTFNLVYCGGTCFSVCGREKQTVGSTNGRPAVS